VAKAGSPTEENILGTINRWAAAARSGKADQVARFYAPRLTRYFAQRGATNADVRRSVSSSVRRNGRPVVLRVSDVRITQTGPNRAVATFRKHWQTGGSEVFAGEEQERMTFARMNGRWKITSEEQLEAYWTHGQR
jgi:ketosteroid isomerase-like protein